MAVATHFRFRLAVPLLATMAILASTRASTDGVRYTWGNGTLTLTFNNHRLGFTEEINIADLHSARCTPRRGDDNHLMTTRR